MLRERFEQYGPLIKARIPLANGRSRGVGFVEYGTAAEAQAALDNENGNDLGGRAIKVSFASDNGGGRGTAPPASGGQTTTIFVGNLGFRTDMHTIKEFFSGCGNVTDVRIAMDQETGRAKGFCHVEFSSPDAVPEAVKLHGANLDGRDIKVDPSEARSGGGGRGGRGGSFGGGGFRGGDRGGFRGGDRGGFRGGFRGGDRGGFRGGDRGGFRGRGGSFGRPAAVSAANNGSLVGFAGKKMML